MSDIELKQASDIFNSAAIKSKYEQMAGQFSVTRYPMDLATANHPHYVMFFINLRRTDIRDMTSPPAIASVAFDNSKNNRMNTEGKDMRFMGTLAGGTGGAGLASGLGGTVGGAADALNPAAKLISFQKLATGVAGIAGAVSGAAVGGLLFGGQDRQQVLLKDVIALYLSGKPVSSFSASWAEEELGPMGGMATAHDNAKDTMFGNERAGNAGSDFAINMVMKSAEKGNGVMGNSGKTFESLAAITPNPFKAQLFKSMKFRTFSFDYVFLPKSPQEYNDVKKIIGMFKRYMHPRLGATKYIMRYPAEFSIAYYFKDAVNTELFRISNCALTDLTVEYGGTDFTTFTPFGSTRGAPTEISMKLKFTELEMLSQERFDDDTGF